MNDTPKMLIGLGLLLIVVGGLWLAIGRWFPLGRLPGDISIERPGFRFYFPVVTSLLLSAVLSLILYLINHLRK